MKVFRNVLTSFTRAALFLCCLSAIPAALAAEKGSEATGGAAPVEVEVQVTAIDLTTRELGLFLEPLLVFSVVVPDKAINLEDINVTDKLVLVSTEAVEKELREPTDQELKEPWEVLQEGIVTEEGDEVSVDQAQLVRAVVTINGIDKEQGMVAVTDSRNMIHFIGDVEPDKLAGIKVGDKVVIIFEQSMALTLEKKS